MVSKIRFFVAGGSPATPQCPDPTPKSHQRHSMFSVVGIASYFRKFNVEYKLTCLDALDEYDSVIFEDLFLK